MILIFENTSFLSNLVCSIANKKLHLLISELNESKTKCLQKSFTYAAEFNIAVSRIMRDTLQIPDQYEVSIFT